jgi:peptidyl-Lys metalloendopeptidase
VYAIYEAGPYSVVYDPAAAGVHVASLAGGPLALKKAAVRTNAATFEVTASRVRPKITATPVTPMASLATSFDHCSADQKSQAQAALPEAVRIAGEARKALQSATPNDRPKAARYKAWFGLYTDTRYAKVRAHFDKIQDALANKAVSFDCGCTMANTYAYVHPTQPYKIFLCPNFWSAPAKGNATDSRPGTLVHETSHFNVVAGTDDIAYGQADAASLAADDPDQAVMNADSHEYFAENTPPKAMK